MGVMKAEKERKLRKIPACLLKKNGELGSTLTITSTGSQALAPAGERLRVATVLGMTDESADSTLSCLDDFE